MDLGASLLLGCFLLDPLAQLRWLSRAPPLSAVLPLLGLLARAPPFVPSPLPHENNGVSSRDIWEIRFDVCLITRADMSRPCMYCCSGSSLKGSEGKT